MSNAIIKYKYYFRDLDTDKKCVIEQDYKSENRAFRKAFQELKHYGDMEVRLEKVEKIEPSD